MLSTDSPLWGQLIDDVATLPDVPPQAAEIHRRCRDALTRQVNSAILQHPSCGELTGSNPAYVIEDNHANHAMLMTCQYRLNDFRLLARLLPWVYRSYHARGFSYDYFPLELQAWKKSLVEEAEITSPEPLLAPYDWMLSHHEDIITLAEDASLPSLPANTQWSEEAEPLLAALLEGRREQCLSAAQAFVESPRDLPHFYTHVVQPAMYRIGSLWETGEISVAQEHLATSLVSRVMAELYTRYFDPEKDKGLGLVSACPGELHQVGSRMVADLLELDGWIVRFLGSDTPAEDLAGEVHERPSEVVGLSTATAFHLDGLRDTISLIRESAGYEQPKIMVGGLAFDPLPELAEVVGADGYARDAQAAVTLARQWWNQNENKPAHGS
ncbi:MAG: B12-binding domain-containing protein [Phycisphaerae bacterium]